MPNPTATRVGYAAFVALMGDALRCACDHGAVPLCVRCECLFRLAVAASDYAAQLWPRDRARLTEAGLAWAHQAASRQGWRGRKED